MADIQHSAIQSIDCHEPKGITTALVADAGKVITPSSTLAGTSVLRKLTLSEIDVGEITDAVFTVVDDADTTKKLKLQLSGITTATTRTLTVPNTSDTLVVLALAQTLSNKTLAASTIGTTRINPRVVALTDGANIASSADTTDVATVTLAGNRNMSAPTGTPVDGQEIVYRLRQDATGGRVVTWDSVFRFQADSFPGAPATPNETSYFGFNYNAIDAKWDNTSRTIDIRA